MSDAQGREAVETYERFVAQRDEIDAGRQTWSSLADFFTEDAAYIDPAWGRIDGREAIRDFFDSSGFTCVDGPIFTPALTLCPIEAPASVWIFRLADCLALNDVELSSRILTSILSSKMVSTK